MGFPAQCLSCVFIVYILSNIVGHASEWVANMVKPLLNGHQSSMQITKNGKKNQSASLHIAYNMFSFNFQFFCLRLVSVFIV